jgi:hypothetical protein
MRPDRTELNLHAAAQACRASAGPIDLQALAWICRLVKVDKKFSKPVEFVKAL